MFKYVRGKGEDKHRDVYIRLSWMIFLDLAVGRDRQGRNSLVHVEAGVGMGDFLVFFLFFKKSVQFNVTGSEIPEERGAVADRLQL